MNKGIVFEQQVLELLRIMGFDAELTKASGDGGIDIIAHKHDDIVGGKYIIQCKNWAKPVGEPPVRDLFGVVMAENANKGILITQSSFTAQAIEFAKGKHLELISGEKLSQLFSKYGLTDYAEENSSIVNQDETIINDLKLQLSKAPQNIIILKALGDIFLLRGDYQEAINYLGRILPLKPEIKTERFQNTYSFGLENYAVALILAKKYDEAVSFFKKIKAERHGISSLDEALFFHYLGLFDLAIKTYEGVKSYYSSPYVDKCYELAYMKTFIEQPALSMKYLDDNGELKVSSIQLETPARKAAEELSQKGWDLSFGNQLFEPINEIMQTWEKIRNVEFKNDHSKIYTSPSLDEFNQIAQSWCDIISDYKNKAQSEVKGECAQIKQDMINVLIAVVEDFNKSLSKLTNYISSNQVYTEDLWQRLESEGIPLNDSAVTRAQLIEEFGRLLSSYNQLFHDTLKKWEGIFEDERTFWIAKLSGRPTSQFMVKLQGPEDRKQLYLSAKELCKDAGLSFEDAKEVLTKAGALNFGDKETALKIIEKYNNLGCKARLLDYK